jgi:hypothetical protein
MEKRERKDGKVKDNGYTFDVWGEKIKVAYFYSKSNAEAYVNGPLRI